MRLNGWQRIGIVASMAWAVWAFQSSIQVSNATAYDLAEWDYKTCFNEKVQQGPLDSFSCMKVRNNRYAEYSKDNVRNAAINALLPILPAWLAVYLTIWTVRWIRAGFQKN